MFGLFKKNKPEPGDPSKLQQFQPSFATQWVSAGLTGSIGGFSGAFMSDNGTKMLISGWKAMWQASFPKERLPEPVGLEGSLFREGDHLLAFILFPEVNAIGEVHFGVAVLGPCADPQWGAEARAQLPWRYFVLRRSVDGTTVEEWTKMDAPVSFGPGPEANPPLFAEWVLNQMVRGAAGATVHVRNDSEAMAEAIARARAELPAVLQRYLDGELNDAGFTVKVAVQDGDRTEHFWLSNTTYAEGYFSGTLDGAPQVVKNVQEGAPWRVWYEEVSDWMYARNKKMHGNYSLRAMLHQLPPEQQATYRAILADEGG